MANTKKNENYFSCFVIISDDDFRANSDTFGL